MENVKRKLGKQETPWERSTKYDCAKGVQENLYRKVKMENLTRAHETTLTHESQIDGRMQAP